MNMKMKKTNDVITYQIRNLVRDDAVCDLIRQLYENRKNIEEVITGSPLKGEFIDKLRYPFESDSDEDHNDYLDDKYFTLGDRLILRELEKLKAIVVNGYFQEEGPTLSVSIINQRQIERIHGWANDSKSGFVVNYGIFGLNTITGEAYCLNNMGIFLPNSGMLRVLKAFLNEPSHCLNYKSIYKIFRNEENPNWDRMTPESIHQIIWDIREKLSMTGKLSRLFVSSSNQYVLRPSLA